MARENTTIMAASCLAHRGEADRRGIIGLAG
jgi:hypothetical protein